MGCETVTSDVLDIQLSLALQGQQRTLTRIFDKMLGTEGSIRMCDRTALILDIFAQRAATHEGQLQVPDMAGVSVVRLLSQEGMLSCQGDYDCQVDHHINRWSWPRAATSCRA